ncbi:MAG: S8 family serine peptidase [Anaerolineae bacterium]|nr:S8 family serine peptidase [Anaerolineae bacterium]
MKRHSTLHVFLVLTAVLALLSNTSAGNIQAQPISTPETQEDKTEMLPYYVWYANGQRNALHSEISTLGGEITHVFDPKLVPAMVVMLPKGQIQTLMNSPEVTFMEPVPEHWLLEQAPMEYVTDAPVTGIMAPTNPQVVPWNVDMVQARDVWDVDRDGVIDPGAPDGSGVKFCIIDTGFYRAHDDFQGIVANGVSQITGENWYEDGNGHGTHVAGTANAVNNAYGVVGVMPGGAQLLIVKIFDNSGAWVTGQSNLGTAAQWCRDNGANAISMSLGGPASTTEDTIFQSLYDDNNMISIAAAGNEGDNTNSYPANYDSVISVAALQQSEIVASFSQFPPTSYDPSSPPDNVEWDVVELSGGGEGVLSTVPYLNGDVPLYQITAGGNTYSGYHVEEAGYTSGSGITAILADGGLCKAANAAWNGKIVLCQRGDISFAEKINFVRSSGGLGVAIYNNIPGNFGATCGGACTQPSIPAISLSQEDGVALLPSVGSNSTLIVYDGSDCTTCTGGYDYMSGTSMATPGVASGVAWVWDSCGGPTGITNKQLRQLLRDSAKDLAGTRYDELGNPYTYGAGYDVHSGWGLIQLADALALGGERYGWNTCPPPGPFVIEPTPIEITLCSLNTNQTVVNLNVGGKDFEGWINLSASGYPAGASATFVHNPLQVTPAGDWESNAVTFGNLSAVASGAYPVTITGVDQADASNTFATDVTLNVVNAAPGVADLLTPASGSINVPRDVTFSWEPAAGADTYTLQIATSPDFAQNLQEFASLTATNHATTLVADTVYYWRVQADNPCGVGEYYDSASFRTESVTCPSYGPGATGLIQDAQNANSPRTTTFSLSITDPGTILDLDVVNLVGTHTYVGDLSFVLAGPDGTQVTLIPSMCTSADNFSKTLDDEAASALACPLADGATQRPQQALSAFDEQERAGTWALRITDSAKFNTGSLTSWYLRICTGTVYSAVCGNLPGSYGMACHRELTGSTLQLGTTWGNQDGIVFSTFVAGQSNPVTVNVQGTPVDSRYLRVWFDWDGNGVFDDTEMVHQDAAINGSNTVDVVVPAGLAQPVAYRVRLYDGQPVTLLAQDNRSYGDTDGGDIADGTSPSPVPTAVFLASFAAGPQGEAILLAWETAAEMQNLGFNLYRAESLAGPWVKLNTELIPAQNPGATFGASYEWLDTGVTPGVTYAYRLEDIDVNGASTFHGPVSATTNGVTSIGITDYGAHGAAPAVLLLMLATAGAVIIQHQRRRAK